MPNELLYGRISLVPALFDYIRGLSKVWLRLLERFSLPYENPY